MELPVNVMFIQAVAKHIRAANHEHAVMLRNECSGLCLAAGKDYPKI